MTSKADKAKHASRPKPPERKLFPVVGIGASAGGLEAYMELLKNLPADTGMAFVVVQHLDPHAKSVLPELLSRATQMPVKAVEDGDTVEPNHVFVLRPHSSLSMSKGRLKLRAAPVHPAPHIFIDHFFQSLAADVETGAIGVLLSGTGSDGVQGLKAIKSAGGITFAQDPATAKYSGMPAAADAAGVVDFVLAPWAIAKELAWIARHPYVAGQETDKIPPRTETAEVKKIFSMLSTMVGVDFSHYKQSTIRRRIFRRMALFKLDRLADYVKYLQQNPAELEALYHDMLIAVSTAAEKKAAEELEISNLLLEASHTLASALGLEPILERLADIIVGTVGLERVSIDLIDERTDELRVVAVRGGPSPPVGTRLALENLANLREVMVKKTTTQIDYEKQELAGEMRRFVDKHRAKLALLVPIVVDNSVIGLITVDQPGERHEFTAREISLVEGIASQAAVTIENARFHERAEATARTFQAIAQMGSLIVSTLTLEEAAPQIIDYSMLLLDLPAAVLLIVDKREARFRIAAAEGIGGKPIKAVLSLDETTSLGIEKPGARPLDLDDLVEAPFFAAIQKRGFAAALLAPIIIDDQVGGYLVGFDEKSIAPSADDLAAFNLFVNQTATAIRNAERYEAERTIAQTLQEVLLTMPDELPGIEFGHLYHSATETARVGGDFYDLFELEDGQVAVVMGDVAGKGLEAASLTALVKNSIKAYSLEGLSVSAVLDGANNVVLRNSGVSNFVTVFFGILDTRSGRFRYCSGGHPPPFLRKASGRVTALSTRGPAIGIFGDLPLEEYEILIGPGDVLVLYTDGTIEARRNRAFLGEKGLIRHIKKHAGLPLAQMPRAIFEDIIDFTGGSLSDDVAIVALGIRPTT